MTQLSRDHEQQLHGVAQYLRWLEKGDASYDPGKRSHERYYKIAKGLLRDRTCDRLLDELVVAVGGERGWTDDRMPLARWDMRAALGRALRVGGPR